MYDISSRNQTIESQGQPLSSPAPGSAHHRVMGWKLPSVELLALWCCRAKWVTSAAYCNLNFGTASAIKNCGAGSHVTTYLQRSQLKGLNTLVKTESSRTVMAAKHMWWWGQTPLSGFYSPNHWAAPFIPFVFYWLFSCCFFAHCLCLISLRVLVP